MSIRGSEVVREVELLKIDGPVEDQRLSIDAELVKELAESIDEVGLMQPILLAKAANRFEVVWGNRRYLAHVYLGRKTILAKVQELDQTQITVMRAVENLFREGITPIEEANIYKSLIEKGGLTIDQVAKRMRKSAGIVRRRLDLLRMPRFLQVAIQKKEINYGVAEALWVLGDESGIQYYLQFAIENGASVAVVRGWVSDEKDKIRRQKTDVGGGVDTIAVNENIPQYIACNVCKEAMKIGEETIIRACPACVKRIIKNQEGR